MIHKFPVLPERQRQVFSAVFLFPGKHLNWYAHTLGLACSTVERCMTRLERLNFINTKWNGNTRRCWPAAWTVAP